MTPDTLPTPAAPGDAANPLDRFLIGQTLRYAVRDQRGILLVAAGTVITPKIKHLLNSRPASDLKLDGQDSQTGGSDETGSSTPSAGSPGHPSSQTHRTDLSRLPTWPSSGGRPPSSDASVRPTGVNASHGGDPTHRAGDGADYDDGNDRTNLPSTVDWAAHIRADLRDIPASRSAESDDRLRDRFRLDHGKMTVLNGWPPRVRRYDRLMWQHLLTSFQDVCRRVQTLRGRVLAGTSISVVPLAQTVATMLDHLRNDPDVVLSVLSEADADDRRSDQAVKTAILAMAVGMELDWEGELILEAGLVSLVHDFGMELVPESVRNLVRPPDELESLEIHKHPWHTRGLLERIRGVSRLTSIASCQIHERPDGSGYPTGRTQRRIHPIAAVVHVADQYVALTSDRPWRKRLLPHAAMECLCHQARNQLVDRDAMRGTLNVLSLYPIGSYVALSDGSRGRIVRRNADLYNEPWFSVIEDEDGRIPEPTLPDASHEGRPLRGGTRVIAHALPTPDRVELELTPEILKRYVRVPIWQKTKLAQSEPN